MWLKYVGLTLVEANNDAIVVFVIVFVDVDVVFVLVIVAKVVAVALFVVADHIKCKCDQ